MCTQKKSRNKKNKKLTSKLLRDFNQLELCIVKNEEKYKNNFKLKTMNELIKMIFQVV